METAELSQTLATLGLTGVGLSIGFLAYRTLGVIVQPGEIAVKWTRFTGKYEALLGDENEEKPRRVLVEKKVYGIREANGNYVHQLDEKVVKKINGDPHFRRQVKEKYGRKDLKIDYLGETLGIEDVYEKKPRTGLVWRFPGFQTITTLPYGPITYDPAEQEFKVPIRVNMSRIEIPVDKGTKPQSEIQGTVTPDLKVMARIRPEQAGKLLQQFPDNPVGRIQGAIGTFANNASVEIIGGRELFSELTGPNAANISDALSTNITADLHHIGLSQYIDAPEIIYSGVGGPLMTELNRIAVNQMTRISLGDDLARTEMLSKGRNTTVVLTGNNTSNPVLALPTSS